MFEGAVRTMLHLFKFDDRRDLARPLARALLAALPSGEAFDVVVPVPLHWTRRLSRGYNQAALLAQRIARARRIPLARRLLVKTRRTGDQAHLDASARRRNLLGSFSVRTGGFLNGSGTGPWRDRLRRAASSPPSLEGRCVLLVDDVLTTGATAEACARALKHAGAARVFVLAVARTPLRGR
jgi:predicted amidophosphoribosyltransferase